MFGFSMENNPVLSVSILYRFPLLIIFEVSFFLNQMNKNQIDLFVLDWLTLDQKGVYFPGQFHLAMENPPPSSLSFPRKQPMEFP